MLRALNSRLSIAARLSLIVAAFALPVGALAGVFIDQSYKDIAFARKEIAGAQYIATIWPTLFDAAATGGLGNDRAAHPDENNALFASAEPYARFQAAEDSASRLSTGRKLVAAIADGSNLTLDPDLDSFYLMDATTVRLPALAAAAAAARDALGANASARAKGMQTVAALQNLLQSADEADNSLAIAMRDNPDGELFRALQNEFEPVRSAANAILQDRTQWIYGVADPLAQRQIEPLLQGVNTTWLAANTELTRLLQTRIESQFTRMERGLALAGVCLALALGLAMWISRGLSTRLTGLTRIMDRLLANDTDVVVPYRDDVNETGHIARTLTAFKESLVRLHGLANHDSLTQLSNRNSFQEAIFGAVDSLGPAGRLAVLYIDLDRFKIVNDTMGHAAGDSLLRMVSEKLRALSSPRDVVARLGGDEFAVLRTGDDDVDSAETFAQSIVDAIAQPILLEGRQIYIGASIGIAFAPLDGRDPEMLLRNADLALYSAKSKGRSRWRAFEPGMAMRILERQLLEIDLREAVNRKQFILYYQPLLNAKTERVVGFEALIRWRHPTMGMVPPMEFIGLAEETGLINPIGQWALEQACQDAARWPDQIRVAVNLSPIQFSQPGLQDQIRFALKASGLAADRLEIEITESIFLGGDTETKTALNALRDIGVRIALDDFGTGYSSLGYLRAFRFDKIKIDRSFVNEIGDAPDSDAIVRAVSALGVSLGISTLAEGVETLEQFRHVRDRGCTEVQGYYFGRPLPLPDAMKILDRQAAA